MWHRCTRLWTCAYCSGSRTEDWSWFSGIYCICLQDAVRRYEQAEQLFHRIGLCAHVVFYRPTRPKQSPIPELKTGEYGCWQSHAIVLSKKCDGYMLVLEDDLKLVSLESLGRIREVCVDKRGEFDVLYLGGCPMNWMRPVAPGVWEGGVQTTEAYITTPSARAVITGEFAANPRLQIDQFLAKESGLRSYFIFPSIFSQREDLPSQIGYSRNLRALMEYRCRHSTLVSALFLSKFPIVLFIVVFVAILLYVKWMY